MVASKEWSLGTMLVETQNLIRRRKARREKLMRDDPLSGLEKIVLPVACCHLPCIDGVVFVAHRLRG